MVIPRPSHMVCKHCAINNPKQCSVQGPQCERGPLQLYVTVLGNANTECVREKPAFQKDTGGIGVCFNYGFR